MPFWKHLHLPVDNFNDHTVAPIPFSSEELQQASREHILLYGIGRRGGLSITLRSLRKVFGIDPEVSEPCFYNQDWYLAEDFMDRELSDGWYLVRKNVKAEARAVLPETLLSNGLSFPPAILCAYTFFAYFFYTGEYLWLDDFVWCEDLDHNGDRVYVGRYRDIDGLNKNGFSVHRHLSLRSCYSAIDFTYGKS